METQANTNGHKQQTIAVTPKPTFTRKARIGINPIVIEEKGTKFLEIKSKYVEKFESKTNGEIDFVMVTDLETGEEGHFWLSGQLRHQLETIQKGSRGTLEGFKMEITHKGKQKVEIDGEKRDVNQYDMFELN